MLSMKQRTLGYIHLSNESHTSELTRHRELLSGSDFIYEDVHCGGRIVERAQFRQLLSDAKKGDTIVCATLDRWAWTLADLQTSINQLLAKGVTVSILEPKLTFSPSPDVENTSSVALIDALADWDTTLQKRKMQHVVRGGSRTASSRPARLIKPRLTEAQLIKAGELQRDGYTVQNIADYFGVSRITMVKYMKQAEENGLYGS
jgi:DNA invertase Pin-like site-specific DNA recombinase